MIVVHDYRGYRIHAEAVATGEGRWNADVKVRRLFTDEKAHHERVTCFKLRPEHAERAAETWAKRWIDLKSECG